jgi:uncharacterized alpha-E superfamily protein
MLSRIADSLFWMARYMDRAENYCATARCHLSHAPGAVAPNSTNCVGMR